MLVLDGDDGEPSIRPRKRDIPDDKQPLELPRSNSWDDEEDQEVDEPVRAPDSRRRNFAGADESPRSSFEGGGFKKSTSKAFEDELNESPTPAPSSRRNRGTSGWTSEAQPSQTSRTIDADDDKDDTIPIIPDLEDQAEEDLTTQLAAPPSVYINRVTTMKELDTDLQKGIYAAMPKIPGVDLEPLTKFLCPPEAVLEEDKPWEWELLYTEISSELQLEREVEHKEKSGEASEPKEIINADEKKILKERKDQKKETTG